MASTNQKTKSPGETPHAVFDFFGDLVGYVDFWLLWLLDLVDAKDRVQLFLPSADFPLPAVPQNVDDYLEFCESTIALVVARNDRIRHLSRCDSLLPS